VAKRPSPASKILIYMRALKAPLCGIPSFIKSRLSPPPLCIKI
jgi:hypothetical protein